jgi:hypothetical protein
MARRTNYQFERREREKRKADKRQKRQEERVERAKARKLREQNGAPEPNDGEEHELQ